MSFSFTGFVAPCVVLSLLLLRASAATVEYDFDIEWVYANPDGVARRPVIGINGQWPIPAISVTKGDRVIVHANNNLGNETTSLHWHGFYLQGASHMDGSADVTQCDIPPGSSFTYDFEVDQPGTYWYHSHSRGQYPDGLRGSFLVIDPDSPYNDEYDEEITLTFSDWYHDLMKGLLDGFISVSNPTGAEPVPNSALMNDVQNHTVPVKPGKTYLIRMINMGAFAAQYVWFEGHTMRIVEVDGVYTEPAEADMIYITAAQRYSVLVTTKEDTSSNFAIMGSMDQDLFDAIPAGLNPNVTGWLVYDEEKPLPEPKMVDNFRPFDDFTLIPHDGEALYDNVDYSITLDMKMDNLGDGANYAFFNDITYVAPTVPTLYTTLSTGANATDPAIYGVNTNPYILNKGDVVEIILNSADPGKHPFHLHGHNFQLVHRSDAGAGAYHGDYANLPKAPMRRDTALVNPNGNLVLRFRADNPGIWLFHCHIEWHVASGLTTTLIEAPLALQETLMIPENHLQVCRDMGRPTEGNAAGNTEDVFDLSGVPTSPSPLPSGFTAGGIAALVFSCVSAFVGMAFVAWYGAAPLGSGAK